MPQRMARSLFAHDVGEFAATYDIGMLDVVLLVCLAVEQDFLHILVFLGKSTGFDFKGFGIVEVECEVFHLRCAEDVACTDGVDGIESHGREHVPR